MCIFIHQLQHVDTILGESRNKEETGNQLVQSSQHTNRGDTTYKAAVRAESAFPQTVP